MTLPASRDITLAPGTQIPSSLLNNLQDELIDGRHHQSLTRFTHLSAGRGVSGVTTYAGGRATMAASSVIDVPLEVTAGDNISSYESVGEVGIIGDEWDMQLIRRTLGGFEDIRDTTTSPDTVGVHEVSKLFFVSELVGPDDTYIIRLTADGGNSGTALKQFHVSLTTTHA